MALEIKRMRKEVTAIMCHDDRVASKLIGYLGKKTGSCTGRYPVGRQTTVCILSLALPLLR